MTKAELIADIEGKIWYVNEFGGLIMENEWPAVNIKLYRAYVIVELDTNVITTSHIYFYVYDEGGPGEMAYYRNATPEDQVGIAP